MLVCLAGLFLFSEIYLLRNSLIGSEANALLDALSNFFLLLVTILRAIKSGVNVALFSHESTKDLYWLFLESETKLLRPSEISFTNFNLDCRADEF